MNEQPQVLRALGKMAIVTMPQRRFPGIWIPADTISTWLVAVEELAATNPEAEYLADTLRSTLNTYVNEMRGRGEALPFAWADAEPKDADADNCGV